MTVRVVFLGPKLLPPVLDIFSLFIINKSIKFPFEIRSEYQGSLKYKIVPISSAIETVSGTAESQKLPRDMGFSLNSFMLFMPKY